ncbi:MAG: single-stranded DNA-binding protein [Deinococcota bacterium]
MARGFNSVHLVGTVTQKPELRYTTSGLAILDINLAGTDQVLGDDGQTRELSWYHRTTVFAKQAEVLADRLEEGLPIFVDARLNHRSWEDPNGQRRSSLDLRAIRIDVLGYGPRGSDPTAADARGQARLKNALNSTTVVGNLTRDAELRYTPNGNAVTRLSMAINEQYRDRSGQDQESTHYVDVQVWRDLAEACSELKKGDPILAVGRFVTDSWTDNDGNKRYQNRIEGTRLEFLQRADGGSRQAAVPQAQASAPAASPAASPPRPTANLDIDEEFPPEEDLPF